MNNSKKIALAVALVCSSGAALAQNVNPQWYVQPNITHVKPDSGFGVTDRDTGGGLKFGQVVNEAWDVQIGGSHTRFKENGARYHQSLLGADALLFLSRNRIRPFVLVGLGLQRDKVENPLRNVKETSPYGTVGIGFQADLAPRWSLQADLRTVRGFLNEDQAFGFKRSNNKYLTVGINYALNPPPAAVVAAATTTTTVAEAPAPAPAPEPAPAPAPAPRFEKVTLEATKLFNFDKAEIILPAPKLDEIAAALAAAPDVTDVDITGYTDRLGSEKYNLKLSERRANAVRDYLVSKGIDGNRLKAYGKGEANPLVTCNQKKRAELIACLEPNRRVEVEQITVERKVQ
ncbi:OmpA family protein [Massilia sp. ZL223]|uniref:OmpA family protein n=1 Tax=Massilia sp. ZL223 TaxID=2824904 RepID=UPI001B82AE49|nr:OmpA family protein [Massilia sp. ZL223]